MSEMLEDSHDMDAQLWDDWCNVYPEPDQGALEDEAWAQTQQDLCEEHNWEENDGNE